MKHFHDPYTCWTHLISRYKANNNPQKVHLIGEFFGCERLNIMSMEKYLVEMKETTNPLQDVNVVLPKDIVVWIVVKNLPKKYDITKQMILNERPPSYIELEMRLLNEESAK